MPTVTTRVQTVLSPFTLLWPQKTFLDGKGTAERRSRSISKPKKRGKCFYTLGPCRRSARKDCCVKDDDYLQ